jgi:XFP C-terminal domain
MTAARTKTPSACEWNDTWALMSNPVQRCKSEKVHNHASVPPRPLEWPTLKPPQSEAGSFINTSINRPSGAEVVVNVVDLTALMMPDNHPEGMDNLSFNALFTEHAPVMFAFHNNRWLIHSMVHGRSIEGRFHVRGYMDHGTTTTPFDMVVLSEMSRFHLALEALKHIPRLRTNALGAIDWFNRKLFEHHEYIRQHLEDMPEIRNWHWTADFSEPGAPPPWPRDIRARLCSRIANAAFSPASSTSAKLSGYFAAANPGHDPRCQNRSLLSIVRPACISQRTNAG